jgi:hypothetical protein
VLRKRKTIVTPQDVARIFSAVNAPAPSAESLKYFAVAMTNIAAHFRPKSLGKRMAHQRAQACNTTGH